jgi:maltose O-acetyltransferase
VTFGSRVLLGQFVSVIGSNHLVRPDGTVAWDEIDSGKRDVAIGNDCWIGAGAMILPGVALGPKTVVGAGAVVTRSFPGGAKLVGSPARPL